MGLRRIARDQRGSINVLGMIALTGMIGALGFSVDLALAYSAKIRNQRASDMAALAAAQSYGDTGSTSAMEEAAEAVVAAAAIDGAMVSASLGPSPDGVGDAVTVRVTTPERVYFSKILGAGAAIQVAATSIARFVEQQPACIISLSTSATNGIDASGGVNVTANNCTVSANRRIRASGGARITALTVTTPQGIQVNGGASITTTPTANQIFATPVSDPLAGNAALIAAFALLGDHQTPVSPGVDVGADLSPPWGGSYSFQGKSGVWNGSTSTWTFPAGNYSIRNLTVPGGQKMVFTGGAGSRITLSGTVSVGGGSQLTIGNGDLVIKQTLSLSGGTRVVIGNGRHYLGPVSVGGGADLEIGAGDLDINGILNISGGGSTVTIGNGNYVFGRATSGTNSGRSIFLSGGSVFAMGNGTFSADGDIKTTGGSSITFGTTANHFINGDLDLMGTAVFGAGRYTVNGDFTNNTGGSMTGSNVSFILAGMMHLTGGTSLNLAAPSSNAGGGLADILIASLSSADSRIGGGSQNIYTGAVYLPNAEINFSGGSGVSGNGGCFTLIADIIDLSGGNSTATSCPNISGASGQSVRLVQ